MGLGFRVQAAPAKASQAELAQAEDSASSQVVQSARRRLGKCGGDEEREAGRTLSGDGGRMAGHQPVGHAAKAQAVLRVPVPVEEEQPAQELAQPLRRTTRAPYTETALSPRPQTPNRARPASASFPETPFPPPHKHKHVLIHSHHFQGQT